MILVQPEWFESTPAISAAFILGMQFLGRCFVPLFYNEGFGRKLDACVRVSEADRIAQNNYNASRFEVNEDYFATWKTTEESLKGDFRNSVHFSLMFGIPLVIYGGVLLIRDSNWIVSSIVFVAGLIAAVVGFIRSYKWRTEQIEVKMKRIGQLSTPQGRMIVATVFALMAMGLKVRTGLEYRVMDGDQKAVKEFESLISEAAKRGQLDELRAMTNKIAENIT
jgi:hypothetical protein